MLIFLNILISKSHFLSYTNSLQIPKHQDFLGRSFPIPNCLWKKTWHYGKRNSSLGQYTLNFQESCPTIILVINCCIHIVSCFYLSIMIFIYFIQAIVTFNHILFENGSISTGTPYVQSMACRGQETCIGKIIGWVDRER